MKKYVLLLIGLLSGCVTHISEPTQSIEKIYAFMIEGENIYLVGEHADYLLKNQDVASMQQFLTSRYAKQTLFFTMKLDSVDNKVKGEYAVYLDESKFNTTEKERLQKQFWFNPISYIHPDLLPALQKQNTNWKANQPALKRQYRAFGQRVRFKNRQEILSKYAMQTPISIPLTQRVSHKEVIADDIVLDIVKGVSIMPVIVAYSAAMAVVITPIAATILVVEMVEGKPISK